MGGKKSKFNPDKFFGSATDKFKSASGVKNQNLKATKTRKQFVSTRKK